MCAVPGGARNWYSALSAHELKWYRISNCTAVTARGWSYQRTAAHYHRRYTVHRTHCVCAQLSNVTWNRRGTVERSRYHYCRGKAIHILYSECESRQLSNTQSALWPVWMYIFSTLKLKPLDLGKQLSVKRVSNYLYNFVWNISHSKKYSTTHDQKSYRSSNTAVTILDTI